MDTMVVVAVLVVVVTKIPAVSVPSLGVAVAVSVAIVTVCSVGGAWDAVVVCGSCPCSDVIGHPVDVDLTLSVVSVYGILVVPESQQQPVEWNTSRYRSRHVRVPETTDPCWVGGHTDTFQKVTIYTPPTHTPFLPASLGHSVDVIPVPGYTGIVKHPPYRSLGMVPIWLPVLDGHPTPWCQLALQETRFYHNFCSCSIYMYCIIYVCYEK